MEQEIYCPNCGKHYYAYDTVAFRCSQCGTVVDVNAGARVYAGRIESQRRAKLRAERQTKLFLCTVPIAIGMFFHSIGTFSLVLVLGAVGWWLLERRINGKKVLLARAVVFGVLLFLLGTIAGDSLWPPTAQCGDGSYSYSAHHGGTCSWHGGVREWEPGPWWARAFR